MVPCSFSCTSHQSARVPGHVADGGSGHTSCEGRTLACHLCYGTSVASRTSCLNNPSGNGRNGEISDNADNKKYDIDPVGGFKREIRIIL